MPDIFDSSQLRHSANSDEPSENSTESNSFDSPVTERKKNAFAKLMKQVHVSSNPLGAFAAQPRNTSLDIQMPEEEVLLLMRQHPFTQLKWVSIALVLILLPLLFSYVPLLNFLPPEFHTVAAMGWFLMVVGFILEAFLDWFYNIYIVTDERIIDVDFNSLLFKNISTAKIDRIEDVTVTSKGYLGSVFDYGTVLIQTAGAVDEFEFEDVPHPNRVSAFINELIIQEEQEKLEGRES